MNVKLTRVLCAAAAGIVLAATGVASTGAAARCRHQQADRSR